MIYIYTVGGAGRPGRTESKHREPEGGRERDRKEENDHREAAVGGELIAVGCGRASSGDVCAYHTCPCTLHCIQINIESTFVLSVYWNLDC